MREPIKWACSLPCGARASGAGRARPASAPPTSGDATRSAADAPPQVDVADNDGGEWYSSEEQLVQPLLAVYW